MWGPDSAVRYVPQRLEFWCSHYPISLVAYTPDVINAPHSSPPVPCLPEPYSSVPCHRWPQRSSDKSCWTLRNGPCTLSYSWVTTSEEWITSISAVPIWEVVPSLNVRTSPPGRVPCRISWFTAIILIENVNEFFPVINRRQTEELTCIVSWGRLCALPFCVWTGNGSGLTSVIWTQIYHWRDITLKWIHWPTSSSVTWLFVFELRIVICQWFAGGACGGNHGAGYQGR